MSSSKNIKKSQKWIKMNSHGAPAAPQKKHFIKLSYKKVSMESQEQNIAKTKQLDQNGRTKPSLRVSNSMNLSAANRRSLYSSNNSLLRNQQNLEFQQQFSNEVTSGAFTGQSRASFVPFGAFKPAQSTTLIKKHNQSKFAIFVVSEENLAYTSPVMDKRSLRKAVRRGTSAQKRLDEAESGDLGSGSSEGENGSNSRNPPISSTGVIQRQASLQPNEDVAKKGKIPEENFKNFKNQKNAKKPKKELKKRFFKPRYRRESLNLSQTQSIQHQIHQKFVNMDHVNELANLPNQPHPMHRRSATLLSTTPNPTKQLRKLSRMTSLANNLNHLNSSINGLGAIQRVKGHHRHLLNQSVHLKRRPEAKYHIFRKDSYTSKMGQMKTSSRHQGSSSKVIGEDESEEADSSASESENDINRSFAVFATINDLKEKTRVLRGLKGERNAKGRSGSMIGGLEGSLINNFSEKNEKINFSEKSSIFAKQHLKAKQRMQERTVGGGRDLEMGMNILNGANPSKFATMKNFRKSFVADRNQARGSLRGFPFASRDPRGHQIGQKMPENLKIMTPGARGVRPVRMKLQSSAIALRREMSPSTSSISSCASSKGYEASSQQGEGDEIFIKMLDQNKGKTPKNYNRGPLTFSPGLTPTPEAVEGAENPKNGNFQDRPNFAKKNRKRLFSKSFTVKKGKPKKGSVGRAGNGFVSKIFDEKGYLEEASKENKKTKEEGVRRVRRLSRSKSSARNLRPPNNPTKIGGMKTPKSSQFLDVSKISGAPWESSKLGSATELQNGDGKVTLPTSDIKRKKFKISDFSSNGANEGSTGPQTEHGKRGEEPGKASNLQDGSPASILEGRRFRSSSQPSIRRRQKRRFGVAPMCPKEFLIRRKARMLSLKIFKKLKIGEEGKAKNGGEEPAKPRNRIIEVKNVARKARTVVIQKI